jgi:hypothetical protein
MEGMMTGKPVDGTGRGFEVKLRVVAHTIDDERVGEGEDVDAGAKI